MRNWVKPTLIQIQVSETLGGNGPCPDGDGGSEAM